MFRKVFVILLLTIFSGFVLAAPPQVDFNYTPLMPGVFTPITFAPDINTNLDLNLMWWMFDTDGNVNYNRTFIPGDINVIFDANFDNNSLAGWDVNLGTWTAPSYLKGASLDGGAISHTVSMTAGRDYNIFYRNDPSFVGLNNEFFFFTDQNGVGAGGVTNISGYELLVQSGTVRLRERTNGAIANLIIGPAGAAVGTYHDININVRTDGNIQVWVDGVSIGSVVDLSYTSGSRIVFATENGATDGNWDNIRITAPQAGGGSFVPTSPIDYNKTEVHTFNTSGNKVVCLTAGNSDGNTTHCETITLIGNVRFSVYDENTHLPITNASAIFNGNTFNPDVNGLITVSTPIVPQDATIEIFAPGYPSRFFTYFLDINTTVSDSVYLLDINKGRDIEFVIRDENGIKYPNRFFRIMKDQNVVSRVYLDEKALSRPIWLANLVTDYNWHIDLNSQGTRLFDYNNSILQIQIPRNENTLELIVPFGIQITDLTTIDLNNLTTARDFNIYPNTFHPYHITIDANNLSYFERYYNLRARGRQQTVLLQPFMLRAIDNGIPATMIVKDSLTSISLQYYLFEFYTDVNQMANVLVESPQTDSAGTFIFTTITGKNYFLKIYDPYGDLIKQGQFISSTSNQYFLDLFTGILGTIDPSTGNVDINLTIPQSNFFFLNDTNNFGIQFYVNTTGPSVTSVNVLVSTSGTTLHNQTFTPTFPATTFPSGTRFDANFSTSLNNINVEVLISVQTSTGTITRSFLFPLKQESNPSVNFPGFGTFCSNIGTLGCSLIWLFIGLLLSIGLRFNPVFGVDNNGMFWVMAIWTGIAAFIGLIPYTIGFIAIIAGASLWAIRNRPIG